MMTSEQRLSAALHTVDDYQPSTDLWTRVLYSIEEDQAHRRRLRRTTLAILFALVTVVIIGWLAMSPLTYIDRNVIDWRVLEIMETVVLLTLILTLGPAVRRFGRGYVHELFVTSPTTASHLLPLLDISYYLVFVSYVLASARFETPLSFVNGHIGQQVYEFLARVGGLLLAMGLLHSVTFMVLLLIALVFNSTRRGTKLPRWINIIVVVVAAMGGLVTLLILLGVAGG